MYTVIAAFNSIMCVGDHDRLQILLHGDELEVFLGIFQQIVPALNRCTYCLLERRIKQ
jgi:hypothetical protein